MIDDVLDYKRAVKEDLARERQRLEVNWLTFAEFGNESWRFDVDLSSKKKVRELFRSLVNPTVIRREGVES